MKTAGKFTIGLSIVLILFIIIIIGIGFLLNHKIKESSQINSSNFVESCSIVPQATIYPNFLEYITTGNYQKLYSRDLINLCIMVDVYYCSQDILDNLLGLQEYKIFTAQNVVCFVGIDNVYENIFICWSSVLSEQLPNNLITTINLNSSLVSTDLINSYIYGLYNSISTEVITYLNTFLNPDGSTINGKTMFLTGHSIGGALALLNYIDDSFTVQRNSIEGYTYGIPKLGNETFSAKVATYIDPYLFFEVVNLQDPMIYQPSDNISNKVNLNTISFSVDNNGDQDYAHYQAYSDVLSLTNCLSFDNRCNTT